MSTINMVLFTDGTFLYTSDTPEAIMKLRPSTDKTVASTTLTSDKAIAPTMPAAVPYTIRTNAAAPKTAKIAVSAATGTRLPLPKDFPPPVAMYGGHWCACGDGGYTFIPSQTPCFEVLHDVAYWDMIDKING